MTPNQIVKDIIEQKNLCYSDVAKLANLNNRQNVWRLLQNPDMKVSTFLALLESMNHQLFVRGENYEQPVKIDIESKS